MVLCNPRFAWLIEVIRFFAAFDIEVALSPDSLGVQVFLQFVLKSVSLEELLNNICRDIVLVRVDDGNVLR